MIFMPLIILLVLVVSIFFRVFSMRGIYRNSNRKGDTQRGREGDVYMSSTQKKKVVDKRVGDYVDYEEVKE